LQQTDRQLQQTDRQLTRQLCRLETLFTGQWGKLVESLVEGNLVELLRERGIQVEATFTRAKRLLNGREFEVDILARNGTEVVAVEVKTTLAPDDVREFTEKLRALKTAFPEYAEKTLYGAVAYLRVDAAADRAACRQGLFVIRATGNSARITNAAGFTPAAW
jgi:Holliday junction resolvase